MGNLEFLPQSTFEKSIFCRVSVIVDIIEKNPNISIHDVMKKLGGKSKRISRKELEEMALRFLSD